MNFMLVHFSYYQYFFRGFKELHPGPSYPDKEALRDQHDPAHKPGPNPDVPDEEDPDQPL
jgi:hypothetical protein